MTVHTITLEQRRARQDSEETKRRRNDNRNAKRRELGRDRTVREITKKNISSVKSYFGCVLCQELDPCCLEFHHIDPTQKRFEISLAVSREYTWETVASELVKCCCVCANCHRKHHADVLSLNLAGSMSRDLIDAAVSA